MKYEKTLAILRLQATKNIGDVLAKKLITATGDAQQIFKEKASTLQKINGIGGHITQQLLNYENIKKAEQEYHYISKNNIQFSYFLDTDYPQNLKHCIDGPILFFKDGTIDFDNQKIISIVGTRKITTYGRDFCNQLITDLAIHNPIIISGFAYGIDICAHKSAIQNNLQTVAVLAHGLEMIYPKVHKKYCAEVSKNGGFITDFWYKEQPIREHFLRRNRIVAGLSKATIVIESAVKGGSLVTADIANSYDRDVFAVPGRTYDTYSKGCNNLIKNNQAHLLNTANDVIKMLNWDISESDKKIPVQNELFVTLNDTEQKIYEYLLQNGKQLFDVIAYKCEIPVYKLSSLLLEMELKGIVKPLPGKLFEV